MCYISYPLPQRSLLSPLWPFHLSLFCLFTIVLLPHSYWLHSSILVQSSCSPSPFASPLSHSIILASHWKQKQRQSNWFCCCAVEPHKLTDWVSHFPLTLSLWPSVFLSLSVVVPPPPPLNLCSLLAFCLSYVPLHLICYFVVFLTHTHMCVHIARQITGKLVPRKQVQLYDCDCSCVQYLILYINKEI